MQLDVSQNTDQARGLLKENVAQRLREEILAARIDPGEKIVEGKWAREYGVAQISVREALNILAAQGFVTKGHGRSARVLKLERADIIHIYQVRGVLEGLAARLIAEDKLPVNDLELAFEEIHHAVGTGDLRQVIGSAQRFHMLMLQGLFAVPMKYATRWNYEHIWLTYGLAGMIVLPWLLTTATVPHLAEVYSLTSTSVLLRIAGFGLCWGIGSVLAGLGMNLLGIGLGMAIILGLSASLGSLIPLLILTPQQLYTHQGHTYLAGTVIMLVGIALCARAGILRDGTRERGESVPGRSFVAGFIV